MRPVFLFDVSVLVLVVRTTAGEADRRGSIQKEPPQMEVQKLAAVVAIEPEQGKRQLIFDFAQTGEDVGGPFVPDGPGFGPTAVNVRECETPDEIARH